MLHLLRMRKNLQGFRSVNLCKTSTTRLRTLSHNAYSALEPDLPVLVVASCRDLVLYSIAVIKLATNVILYT